MILEHIAGEMDEYATELKARLEELSTAFEEQAAALKVKLLELKKATDEQRARIQEEIKEIKASLKRTWDEWVEVTRMAARQYEFAH